MTGGEPLVRRGVLDLVVNVGACALMMLANVMLLRLITLAEPIFIARSGFSRANQVSIVSAVIRAAANPSRVEPYRKHSLGLACRRSV